MASIKNVSFKGTLALTHRKVAYIKYIMNICNCCCLFFRYLINLSNDSISVITSFLNTL